MANKNRKGRLQENSDYTKEEKFNHQERAVRYNNTEARATCAQREQQRVRNLGVVVHTGTNGETTIPNPRRRHTHTHTHTLSLSLPTPCPLSRWSVRKIHENSPEGENKENRKVKKTGGKVPRAKVQIGVPESHEREERYRRNPGNPRN